MKPYRNRVEAGRILAEYLRERRGLFNPVVIGVPRGGIPVAEQVARALDAPLDFLVTRKVRLPDQPELVVGAIATGDVRVLNENLIRVTQVPSGALEEAVSREQEELERSEALYCSGAFPDLTGRTVVLVDDGLASGLTLRAAATAVASRNPARMIVAVPAASRSGAGHLDGTCEVVCPLISATYRGTADWYTDYSPPADDEVMRCVSRIQALRRRPAFPIG